MAPPWMVAVPACWKPRAACRASEAGLGGSVLTSAVTAVCPAAWAAAKTAAVEGAGEASAAGGGADDDAVHVEEAGEVCAPPGVVGAVVGGGLVEGEDEGVHVADAGRPEGLREQVGQTVRVQQR